MPQLQLQLQLQFLAFVFDRCCSAFESVILGEPRSHIFKIIFFASGGKGRGRGKGVGRGGDSYTFFLALPLLLSSWCRMVEGEL